jgi:acyl-CoA reductase-like NAD-dependent aldehyde dehydrogenase
MIAADDLFATGYFMQPSIVTNIDAKAPLVVEEQFCPTRSTALVDRSGAKTSTGR